MNFVPDDKLKIAYAASFAIDQIAENVKPMVKENISRFHAVGVRETSWVKILNELGIHNATQVLDPVFLLPKEHWLEFVKPINKDFVFVNDFDSNPIIEEIALRLKKQKGWKIYTVNQNIGYADKNYWLEGPETFLSLVSQSKYNLTNSFHSTAFSILFQKQFVVVNRKEKINTRMRDLLDLFQLRAYLVSNIEEFEGLEKIDYNIIDELVGYHAQRSKEFLVNALK